MMKDSSVLPENYGEFCKIDLQKNMKQAVIVNVLALVICLLMGVIASIIFTAPFELEFMKIFITAAGIIVYMILHELVHGIFMTMFSDEKPHYGFTGMYAYAGSDAYFSKKHYVIIALAPVIVWGAVLVVMNMIVPESWVWYVYFIQIMNISGAAGDLYVTYYMQKLPKDILVKDTGVSMTVYSQKE